MTRPVAVLFARNDSVYKTIAGCDVWDAERDARRWPGGHPVIAHPPCAQWSRLRYFAHDVPEAKALAPWAVGQVRANGGVLEHPASSVLWKEPGLGLPARGRVDAFGGWTLGVHQADWGHRAEKATNLYIVGCPPSRLPPLPIRLELPTHVVASSSKKQRNGHARRPAMHTREREATPPAFAAWLVEVARRCGQ